jgi:hypothetical protein
MAVSFSGSLDISGSLTTTGTIVMSGSIASASFAQNATTASNANTSSYVVSSQTDASQNTRLTAIEAVTGSYATTSSLSLASASVAAINVRTGSYATTGSNYFIGTQVITGSVYIANDLIVQGSSSLQNITASAISVGTNTIILNTNTPILQFGGIAVFDSGSTMGRSGSLLWNSINDHWLNVNPSGSDEGYNSAMVINGPKNTGSLGNEVGLTLNYIPVSQGEDHITDSIIFQSGSNIGIGTSALTSTLDVNGNGRYAGIGLNATPISKGTSQNYIRFTNTGNDFYIGQEGSTAGAFFTGTNAYDNTLYGDKSYNFIIGGSSKLYISGSGNVGIGTNNPSTALHIQASVPTIRLTNSSAGAGAGSIQFYSGSTQIWNLGTHTNNDMYLYNNTTSTYNYWVQNSSGNIGIGGTTSPNSLVEITKSSNAGSGATFPRLSVANTLATQGDGSSTYNFADLRLAAGNGAVEVYLTSTFAAGTWEPQGILNVGTNHPLSFKTNNTERMRILSGGNVGIGSTSPSTKLQVTKGSSGNIASFTSDAVNTSNYSGITLNSQTVSGDDWYGAEIRSINTDGNPNYLNPRLGFFTQNYSTYLPAGRTEKMSILGNGHVGIGTTTPTNRLHIASADNEGIFMQGTANGGHWFNFRSANSNLWSMGAQPGLMGWYNRTDSSYKMVISDAGNVGIGTTNPSAQLSGTIGLSIVNATNAALGLSNGTNHWLNYLSGTTYRIWNNSVSEVVTIKLDGKVGIGTTDPSTKFRVNGDVALGGSLNSSWAVSVDNLGTTDAHGLYVNIGASSTGVPFSVYKNFSSLFQIANSGVATFSSTVQPGANGTQDLGTSSLRWGTVFTSDLSLSNGIGDYTIVEGENDLFLYNNKQNKVYKFMLAEVDPADATPKKS